MCRAAYRGVGQTEAFQVVGGKGVSMYYTISIFQKFKGARAHLWGQAPLNATQMCDCTSVGLSCVEGYDGWTGKVLGLVGVSSLCAILSLSSHLLLHHFTGNPWLG